MPLNVTFRTQLLGGVTEFCNACEIPILSNALHLVELIVLLSKYKEEGVSLFPEVYITTDVSSLLAMLPDAERLPLGAVSRDVKGIKYVIKKAAPLAVGGWLVFIEDSQTELKFGLFRGSGSLISVLIDNVLIDQNNPTPVTKVVQIAEDCVEIVSKTGDRHLIFLNHRKEDSPPPLKSLSNLIVEMTRNVDEELREPTQSLLTRVLYNALRTSHGTLIAVTDKKAPPKRLFNDGLILHEPINFAKLIYFVKKGDIPAEKLNSMASVLEGMLNSDGIILFNDKSEILGFNFFVKSKPSDEGGARRRAFNTLEGYLGRGLTGAFIQSQDGWSDFRG